MTDVINIKDKSDDIPDRPDSVALVTTIEECIASIASEKMTPIEVLGVLDLVSKRFYEDNLSYQEP